MAALMGDIKRIGPVQMDIGDWKGTLAFKGANGVFGALTPAEEFLSQGKLKDRKAANRDLHEGGIKSTGINERHGPLPTTMSKENSSL